MNPLIIITNLINNTKKYNQPLPITLQIIKDSFLSIKPNNKSIMISLTLMNINTKIKRFMIHSKSKTISKHQNLLNSTQIHFVDGKIISFMISIPKMTIKTIPFLENGADFILKSTPSSS